VKTIDQLKPLEAKKGSDFGADCVGDLYLVGEAVFVTVRVLEGDRDLTGKRGYVAEREAVGVRDVIGAHISVAVRDFCPILLPRGRVEW
jgi:hypothetical protein